MSLQFNIKIMDINILHLEDNLSDAELIRFELEKAFSDIEIIQVDNKKDFLDCIETEEINLILSDYDVPGFDGMEALQLIKNYYHEIPFIFVSGTIGEEKAVEVLRNGAVDYVLKDNLAKIAFSVNRALKEVRDYNSAKAALDQLERNEERISKLFETAIEGIITVNIHGNITMSNIAICKMFGYTKEELINTPLTMLIPQKNKSNHGHHMDHFFSNSSSRKMGNEKMEIKGLHKNGTTFPIGVALSSFDTQYEKLAVAFVSDLTEMHETKTELHSQANLLLKTNEMAKTGSWQWDIKENKVTWNKILHQIFETDENFEPTFDAYLKCIDDEEREGAGVAINTALENKSYFDNSYKITTYKGNVKHLRTWGKVEVDEENNPVRMIGVCMDVTEQTKKNVELKIAKDNLSNMVDYANIGIAYANAKAVVISVNKKFANILEYNSIDDLVGKKVADFAIDDDFENEMKLIQEIKENKRDIYQIEKRYLTQLNNIRWIDLNVSVIRNDLGEVENYVAMVIDITDKKESQEKLAEAEKERYLIAIQTEENERQRLSQDLHDGLGQTIAAASLYMNALDDLVESQLDAETYEVFTKGKELVNKSAKETRMVSHNIMPPSLNQFGLSDSLAEMISNYQKIKVDVNINFTSNLKEHRFKQEVELSLYRVVQELINNALKHSKADCIDVSVLIDKNKCEIRVKDNGVGFIYDEVKKNKKSGIGLMNIEQRIIVIGGKLDIINHDVGVEFVMTMIL